MSSETTFLPCTQTKRFFLDAGVGEGMRAMEIGCGGGEVTYWLVGETGEVYPVSGRAFYQGLKNS